MGCLARRAKAIGPAGVKRGGRRRLDKPEVLECRDDAIMIDNTDMDFEASCELLLDVIRGSVAD